MNCVAFGSQPPLPIVLRSSKKYWYIRDRQQYFQDRHIQGLHPLLIQWSRKYPPVTVSFRKPVCLNVSAWQ